MIPKSVQDALNHQIQKELFSAYYYLSMAAHFQSVNLGGFSHWMKKQFEEETSHAMKIYGFLHDRGGRVVLDAIEKPPGAFKSPLEIMRLVLDHEKKVTASINSVYELAVKEKDYPTQIMLEWFINEQVEEEKSAEEIINTLQMIGNAPAGLVMLDRQMAARGS